MSTKLSVKSEEVKGFLLGAESFWGLTKNVGYGYPNLTTDVLLVQFFINAVYHKEILEPDGRFGGKTWNAIKYYQRDMGLAVDGMVSAAQGENLRSPKLGRIFAIYEMNREYKRCYGHLYDDLNRDPNLPRVLCDHFSVPYFDSE